MQVAVAQQTSESALGLLKSVVLEAQVQEKKRALIEPV
jgi:hypothetical protein